MLTLTTNGWSNYELLDSGDGQRLERFGEFTMVRPDPNVIWKPSSPELEAWKQPDLRYVGDKKQPWVGLSEALNGWTIGYEQAKFQLQPTPFRHVGLFPEQVMHWQWLQEKIAAAVTAGRKPKVLNLFAYTGAASVIAAQAGAEVCHVDASKTSIFKAKDNAKLSGLSDLAIRWIVDDVVKFLHREVRRGNTYDLIIMDPPVFGRGPKGEIWRLEDGLQELAELSKQLLSKEPLGFLLNFYATSLYPQSVERVFTSVLPKLDLQLGILSLQEKSSKKLLPTGFFVRS